MQQDERIVHRGNLLVLIVDEVRGQIATVELHAFHHVQLIFQTRTIFNGNHAFLAHLIHRFGNLFAHSGVGVGRNGAHLRDFLAGGARLGNHLQLCHGSRHSLVNPALQIHGVHASGHELHAFHHNGLRQHGRGRGTVTGHIRSLGSHFLDHLRAHVLELVLQFDFLGHGHTILSDGGGTIGAIQHHITTFRAQGNLHGIGQNVHACYHFGAGCVMEFYVFSCHCISPEFNKLCEL